MADPSDRILQRLMGLHPKVIDLSLDRQHRIHAALGHPERRLPPTIHVAGTNGKGSTVAIMRAILEAAGLKVHVYTSPHLCRFHERIRLAGKLISEEVLSALLDECEAANDGEPITFFEITTAAAFLAFSRTAADVLLLETGLGGAFDSTNVLEKVAASVLTPVDMDHQQFLGDDILGIARTKAGIMKPGCPVIIGDQRDEVREELLACARDTGSEARVFGQDWMAYEEFGRFVYQDDMSLMDLPHPNLPGHHQVINAGTALAALRYGAGLALPDHVVAQAITHVNWPARMQRLGTDRKPLAALEGSYVWLDGGHNPHAGKHIAATFEAMGKRDGLPLYLVAGMLNTKDASGFFRAFAGQAEKVLTVAIEGEENSLSPGDLARLVAEGGVAAEPLTSFEEAVAHLANIEGPKRILLCGSLYFAGEVLRKCSALPE